MIINEIGFNKYCKVIADTIDSTDEKIVGINRYGQSLYVATNKKLYLIRCQELLPNGEVSPSVEKLQEMVDYSVGKLKIMKDYMENKKNGTKQQRS